MSLPPTSPLAPHEGRLLGAHEITHDAEGFLRLAAMECRECGTKVFPPGDHCPSCLGTGLATLPVRSIGRLYSYTTVHVAPPQWQTPYVLGYVDFAEGVRVFGKVKADPAQLAPDLPVTIEFMDAVVPEKGTPTYRYCFVPA